MAYQPIGAEENGDLPPVVQTRLGQIYGRPYHHVQSTAAATWTITHSLGRYPAGVSVIVGTVPVDADVSHPTVNTTVVSFPSPTSGRVELI